MTADFPKVSLVLVTMNSAVFVRKALDSIRAQTYPADRVQTIVVDHDSRDGTPQLIARDYPWVVLLAEKANHGFAGGNNIGMRRYPADYYALVNPDVVLKRDWLQTLISAMEADSTIGVAGSKIYYGEGKLLQHAGAMVRNNALTYHIGDREADNGQCDARREVDYVMGAALVARGELTRQLGYLPEVYFPAYYEEADFCAQVWAVGARVVYIPEAIAYHDEKFSGSGSMSLRFLRRYHKHRYLYALRNFRTDAARARFREAERDWRRQYASSPGARLLLIYSKAVNWRHWLRDPWLLRV